MSNAASADELRRRILRGAPGPSRPPLPSQSSPSVLLSADAIYTPLPWNDFFSSKETAEINDDIFRIYKLGNTTTADVGVPTAIVMLHGGGFSGLTWARFSTLLIEECSCELYAIDLRGHGETRTINEYDLSTDTLSRDVVDVINKLELSHSKVVLMGHSMGGALAVHTALRLQEAATPVAAVIVVDVVEGSAMESLATMPAFLRGRPTVFESISASIKWSLKTGHTRDNMAARVSMPGQLKCSTTQRPATEVMDNLHERIPGHVAPNVLSNAENQILEEDEDDYNQGLSSEPSTEDRVGPPASLTQTNGTDNETLLRQLADYREMPEVEKDVSNVSSQATQGSTPTDSLSFSVSSFPPKSQEFLSPDQIRPFVWRIDLLKTESHWRGWFEGLSKKFLAVTSPKLLILAGVDRMDKEMMVAQMQGKFEVQFLKHVGHVVHEDNPSAAVGAVSKFLIRHKLAPATTT